MSTFSEADKLLNAAGRASSSSPSRIVDSLSTVTEDSGKLLSKGETDIENAILSAGNRNAKRVQFSASVSSTDFIANENIKPPAINDSTKQKEEEKQDTCSVTVEEEEESAESGPEAETKDASSWQKVEGRGSSKSAQHDSSIDSQLPETVALLKTPDGGKVYLVGTAHFSIESQEDVAKIIRAVQPHIVMVELCKARVNILQLDEKTILEEAKNINFEKIRSTIKENGLFHGLMYILLLSMSAHLTEQLGMAPGGEFRRAFAEAKQVPNCPIHLGDRPIHITLQRALASLSWWQTLRLTWHLLMSKEPISKEEVERCKRRDLLEEMLAEMAGEFPALGTVFVDERDIYLTNSLQLAALPQRSSTGIIPSRVVGVVGIGHVRGIVENWGKVSPADIPPIMRVPPPSLSSRMLKLTFKASLVGLAVWGVTRFVPLPKVIPNSVDTIRSSVQGFLHIGGAAPGPGKV